MEFCEKPGSLRWSKTMVCF